MDLNLLRQKQVEVILLLDSSTLIRLQKTGELQALFAGSVDDSGQISISPTRYAVFLGETVQGELWGHVQGKCSSCSFHPAHRVSYANQRSLCPSKENHRKAEELCTNCIAILAWFKLPQGVTPPGPVHVPVFVQNSSQERILLAPFYAAAAGASGMTRDMKIVLTALNLSKVLVDLSAPIPVLLVSNDLLQRIFAHLNFVRSVDAHDIFRIFG